MADLNGGDFRAKTEYAQAQMHAAFAADAAALVAGSPPTMSGVRGRPWRRRIY